MYNYAGFFAQYYEQMPEAQQYDALIEYDINPSSQIIDRAYTQLYAGALEDLKTISESEDVTPADRFAVSVLRAFSFQLLVDNMDQAPYSEALMGSENPMPKWDGGQAIYEGVLAEMEEAEKELGESAMTCTDCCSIRMYPNGLVLPMLFVCVCIFDLLMRVWMLPDIRKSKISRYCQSILFR